MFSPLQLLKIDIFPSNLQIVETSVHILCFHYYRSHSDNCGDKVQKKKIQVVYLHWGKSNNLITSNNFDDTNENDDDDDDVMTSQFLKSILRHSVGQWGSSSFTLSPGLPGPFLIHKCFHGNRDLGSLIESLHHLGNRAKGGAWLIVFSPHHLFCSWCKHALRSQRTRICN